MEDKWFIYYENDTLNLHRSWTGHHIYQLTFAPSGKPGTLIKAVVNRDPSEYNQIDDAYDIQLLNFLIDRLLLSKSLPFPVKNEIDKETQALYQHSAVGHGRSNKED